MTARTFDPERFLSALWALDKTLAKHGVPKFSPWWRAELTRFIRGLSRGGVRQWVLRVGRRGGKSTSWEKFSIAWAKYGPWQIPSGERATVAFLSVSKDEATERLRAIGKKLSMLGDEFEQRGDEIELKSRPCVFKVYACTIRAVGFTSILVVCDECARWESRDDHTNPAGDVVGSLKPTLATMPFGFMVLSSSPWTCDDFHAAQFDRGDAPDQIASHAPTWLANPTLTEAGTRALEPDDRTWSREYAAIPSSAAAAVFSADWITKAQARWLRVVPLAPVVVTDPSGGKRDSWTWGACQWVRLAPEEPEGLVVERRKLIEDRNPWTGATFQRTVWERVIETPEGEKPYRPVERKPFLHIMAVDGETGRFSDRMSADDVVERIAGFCRPLGQHMVTTDNFSAYALKSTFLRQGLYLQDFAWNNENKTRAVEHAVRLFREGQIAIPPEHARLASELARFDEKLTPSGYRTFGARGNGHDDFVSVILMAALLDLDGQIPGSPTVLTGRHIADPR